jgi:predicted tellurium resistance membrane protein TerC
MAVLVVYILDVPGFLLAGGLALVWIARKLLMPDDEASRHAAEAPARSFAGALRTIVVADAIMGVDNVLAIGGAASGSIL